MKTLFDIEQFLKRGGNMRLKMDGKKFNAKLFDASKEAEWSSSLGLSDAVGVNVMPLTT